jgi:hypothetical protein
MDPEDARDGQETIVSVENSYLMRTIAARWPSSSTIPSAQIPRSLRYVATNFGHAASCPGCSVLRRLLLLLRGLRWQQSRVLFQWWLPAFEQRLRPVYLLVLY